MKADKIKTMVLCAMFTALIAAGAFIKIPIPVLPFTLQYLFTMLAGLLLGGKNGAVSVLLYIILGLIGFPIFTMGGGIGYIFQPTFGYLIGFAVGAFVTGTIANKTPFPSSRRLLAANFAGLAVLYICGMVYLYIICNFYLERPIGFWALFLYCFLLPIPGDIVLSVLGMIIGKRLIPIIRKGEI